MGTDPSEGISAGRLRHAALKTSKGQTLGHVVDLLIESTSDEPPIVVGLLVDDEHRLDGQVALPAVLRADPATHLRQLPDPDPRRLRQDAGLVQIARLMTDHDLLLAPVVDGQDGLAGVVAIDDLAELLLPATWRRSPGMV
jgi:Mg/Co/Ni transporter MgtE